ncbi:MAG: LPS export ABC transporter permease LptF [Legionellales bacterium]|nr:MAG: LPS export ABC transporter permease LptF [Legionellales bacterium]
MIKLIVTRYISREISWNCIAIFMVLLAIALSNKFVALLAKSATGVIPASYIFKLIGLYIPELAVLLLPLAFFVAVLFTYSRLNTDSEMTILLASGFSFQAIAKIIIANAAIVALLVAGLTLYAVPKSIGAQQELLKKAMVLGAIDTIVPGKFQEFADNGTVFYIENSARKSAMHGAFIASETAEKRWVIITADQAKIHQSSNNNIHENFLVLQDGHRYVGAGAGLDLSYTNFSEYGRAIIPETKMRASQASHKARTTVALWHATTLRDNSELQWRVALPISVVVLAFWAILLSAHQPRRERILPFIMAVVVYVVYFNLLTMARRWIYQDIIPTFVGLWWVHILAMAIVLFFLHQKSRNKL